MEQQILEHFSIGAIFIAVIVGFIKGFFSKLVKNLFIHLKRKQKLYYATIGSFGTLFIIYSILTVKTQINAIQSKFDNYENLKIDVLSGAIANKHKANIETLIKISQDHFLEFKDSKTQVNFLYRSAWKEVHISSIFGVISIHNGKVAFEYKDVIGKNKNSDRILDFENYLANNTKLFASNVYLQDEDKEAFLNNSVKDCVEQPIKINLEEMEKHYKAKTYVYKICDFLKGFFYTTGRMNLLLPNKDLTKSIKLQEEYDQKTFNDINHIYYILIPYHTRNESKMFFYYAFNSDRKIFLDSKVTAILGDFLGEVNKIKSEMKDSYKIK